MALHRDAAKRFGSLQEMTRAWTDIFRDLETVPPLTTSATVGLDEIAPMPTRQREQRGPGRPRPARRSPRPGCPRAPCRSRSSASASPPSASWSASRPAASPSCAASAAGPATSWSAGPGSGGCGCGSRRRPSPQERSFLPNEPRFSLGTRTSSHAAADAEVGDVAPADDELAHLSVDEIVARLIPEPLSLGLVVGLTGPDGAPPRVPPWANQLEIAAATGLTEEEVGNPSGPPAQPVGQVRSRAHAAARRRAARSWRITAGSWSGGSSPRRCWPAAVPDSTTRRPA